MASLPAFAQSAPKSKEIITQENVFWHAYVDGNKADLDKLFTADFTNVEQNIWTRKNVLNFIDQFHAMCTLAPVVIRDPQVTFLTPEIATIVYHETETPTCGTHSMSDDTNISTVWVHRNVDGAPRWQMQLHSEYAIPPK